MAVITQQHHPLESKFTSIEVKKARNLSLSGNTKHCDMFLICHRK